MPRDGPDDANKAAAPAQRPIFLPHRASIIELIFFFAIAVSIEQIWLAPLTFASLEPHPYWLPVILLSLQYGTADGLLAAFAAILISLATGLPTQGVAEDYYAYVTRTWAEPVGWILTAVVVGEIRGRQLSRVAGLKSALGDAVTRAETIAAYARALEAKIVRLERRLTTADEQTFAGTLLTLSGLKTADPAGFVRTFEHARRALLADASCALLVRSARAVVVVAAGQAAPGGARLGERVGQELVAAVFEDGRALSFRNESDHRALGDGCLYALPLRGTAHTRPFAALLVAATDPAALDTRFEDRLGILGREVAHALIERGYRDLIEAGQITIPLEGPVRGEGARASPGRLNDALDAVALEEAAESEEGLRPPRKGGSGRA